MKHKRFGSPICKPLAALAPVCLAAAVSLAGPVVAQAQSSGIVYLTCHQRANEQQVPFYLTIDYGASTVTTMYEGQSGPEADMKGRSAIPAQVTTALIQWDITKRLGGGTVDHTQFKLSRLTGDLNWYDSGTQHGDSLTCHVGNKPVPKF